MLATRLLRPPPELNKAKLYSPNRSGSPKLNRPTLPRDFAKSFGSKFRGRVQTNPVARETAAKKKQSWQAIAWQLDRLIEAFRPLDLSTPSNRRVLSP
jgi:hypothetical protein